MGNGTNGPECVSFPEGTPILTPDGLMAIESLKVGDIVVSRSDASFITEPQRITQTFHRVAEGYQTLLIETLNPIRVTPEHPSGCKAKGGSKQGISRKQIRYRRLQPICWFCARNIPQSPSRSITSVLKTRRAILPVMTNFGFIMRGGVSLALMVQAESCEPE